MWGGQQQQQKAGGGMAGMYGGGVGGGMGGGGSQSQQAQKHDIFVGNLSFNTTEDQLHQAFSEIGRVINVRMVTDQETGKPRGFAFVEFEDPQVALSAIRNMNDYELNGRRLRVNFSNSSHLEALAGKLGMDLSQQTGKQTSGAHNNRSGNNSGSNLGSTNLTGAGAVAGTNAVADALKSFSKGEMYDVIAKLKEIADRDPDEARRVISGHPQLPEALLFLMSKLDMVKTPIEMASMPMAVPVAPAVPIAAPPVRAADPRAAGRVDPRQQQPPKLTQPAAAPPRMDPRQQQQQQAPPVRSDPRADPRAAARANAGGLPPPPPPRLAPPPPPPASTGAPPPPPPPPQGNVANLDPGLVQQVMSLTPQQIAGLPPDQQQSILQLRQQITGKWG